MQKYLVKLSFLYFIINECVAQQEEANNENHLRSLKPTPLLDSNTKNSASLKLHSKLLQTVYSESYSKNYYYTTLYIGPQHVKQTYIIDTGSSIMSSPCKPCTECGANKKNYLYTPLKNHKTLKCGTKVCQMVPATNCIYKEDKEENNKLCSYKVKQSSGDGISGYYLDDIVYFETDNNITSSPLRRKMYRSYALPIGCTTAEYGKYKELNADGIMGVNNNEKSFINLLYNLKIINRDIFSLCFSLRGGYMSMGEIDKTYHKSKKIEFVPLLKSNIFYLIKVNGIMVGNNKNTVNSKTIASIDTGNTMSYFPPFIYKSLIKEFSKFCKSKGGGCGNFQYDSELGYCASFKDRESLFKAISEYWPNITLQLGKDTNYIWKPINYYYYFLKLNTRKACLGFNSHKSQNIVLGTNFIHGYDVIFDRENQRLGFVQADCSRGNMLFNRMKGSLKPHLPIFETNPALVDKEIHKNEKEGKFNLGDDTNNKVVDFIQGHNTELDFSSDFKMVNFIILLSSIVIVVVVIVVVVSNLLCYKREYLKYDRTHEYAEETDDNDNREVNGENKITFDEK